MTMVDMRKKIASVLVLVGTSLIAGCASQSLESEQESGAEESPGQTSQALFCSAQTAFSATASPNAIQPASNAIDQSSATRWESAWADNQSITIDLNTIINMGGVTLNWEAACGRDYDIDWAGLATGPWTRFATVRGNTQSGVVTHEGYAHKARYVRMTGLTRCTQYGFSLWEFSAHWISNKCYTDSDRDSQGVAGSFTETCGDMCAVGRSRSSNDCYDSNANAKVGQTNYFTAHRGDGSFDYNCNGTVEKQSVTGNSGCAAGSAYPNCIQATGVRPLRDCGAPVPLLHCVAMAARPGQPAHCATVTAAGPAQRCH